jgi:hypothetical protein
MAQLVNKKVDMELIGLNSNIFNLLGVFVKEARRQKWTSEEIDKIQEAVFNSDDYDKALSILSEHVTHGEGEIAEEDLEDDEINEEARGLLP